MVTTQERLERESPEVRQRRLNRYRRYYQDHKDKDAFKKRRLENDRAWKAVRRDKIRDYVRSVKDVPCVDCGVSFPPEIMDLDHVRGEKRFAVSHSLNGSHYATLEEIKEEVAKCEVRCPTCHRMRHYLEDSRLLDFAAKVTKRAAPE